MYPKFKTSKLFYKKYPYKISIRIPIRDRYNGSEATKVWRDILNLNKAKKIGRRCEFEYISVFAVEKELYEILCQKYKKFIKSVTEPGSEAEMTFLEGNSRSRVLVDRYRWGRFQYKVFFQNDTDLTTREKILKVVRNLGDWARCSYSTYQWLEGTKRFWCPYPGVLVADSKSLLQLTLAAGFSVQRIEEYVLRSGINTLTEVDDASTEPTTTVLSD